MAANMPQVDDCTALECSYNKEGACHAMAINVGGPAPWCDTFIKASIKGGVQNLTGGVGACKVENCTYNRSLECTSQNGIHIKANGDHAVCSTFSAQ
jgi:hypothetical protein